MDTETINPVDIAQDPEVFDVLSFVEQTAYPTENVVVFQDVKSATEYVEAVTERNKLDAIKKPTDEDKQKSEQLTEQIATLGDKVAASSIVFQLRGMPPGIVNEILGKKDDDDTENEQARDNKLIAKSIIRVTNSKGVEDPRVWQAEDVARLRVNLKEGEFSKLLIGVGKVNFNAVVFDQATDAGFSGRSSDVA